MKLTFTLALLLILAACLNKCVAQAVNKNDSLALVDLYISTKGASWVQNYNWLTGPVSSWYGITVEQNRVTRVGLTYNNLNGPIPASFGNLSALQYLEMDHNPMRGSLPSSMGNLTQLISFYIWGSHLSGSIPESFGNLKNLEILVLHNNNLSGNIPSSIGSLPKLGALYLYSNHLSGNMPVSILKNPTLAIVGLSLNELTLDQNIPADLPKLPRDLNLNDNRFTFNGLEYMSQISSVNGLGCRYSKQAQVAIHKHGNTLAVTAGGTLANNVYRWYKVGTADSTTIYGDSIFTPQLPGNYYAKIRNKIAKKLVLNTDTVYYTNALQSLTALSLFPNPAKASILLKGLNAAADSYITITNLNGQVIKSLTSIHQPQRIIDVSSLRAGSYILHVTNKENAVPASSTFIKE